MDVRSVAHDDRMADRYASGSGALVPALAFVALAPSGATSVTAARRMVEPAAAFAATSDCKSDAGTAAAAAAAEAAAEAAAAV